MNSASDFAPKWASPPGESIAEVLSHRGWTVKDLAARLEVPADLVEDLLTGTLPITIGVARKLNTVIGASVAFWIARDRQYRQDLERLQRTEEEWRSSFPVAELGRMGWLPQRPASELAALLSFFNVPSVAAWQHQYSEVLQSVSLRTSRSFESEPGAVVAWIRRGELVARDTPCKSWNAEGVTQALAKIRSLTRVGKPERFLPKLRAILAEYGVAVALVPAPTGCRASGSALWLSHEKAVVILSARHLTDDHFWFTLYHECAHLLLHRDGGIFIDNDPSDGAMLEGGGLEQRENEANEFAVEMLVGPHIQEALQVVPLTYDSILRLATKAGTAPGILVGQLQKHGRLGHERLNRLKRRYEWVDGQLVSRETK